MNDLQRKIIEEFRTNTAPQCFGALHIGESFCASGLVANAYVKEGLGRWDHGLFYYVSEGHQQFSFLFLPRKIDSLTLSEKYFRIPKRFVPDRYLRPWGRLFTNKEVSLEDLNDHLGLPLSVIGGILESYWRSINEPITS